MTDLSVSSGAKVVVNSAPFREAVNLQNAILRELARSGFDVEGLKGKAIKDVEFKGLIPALMGVVASDDVYNALLVCLGRCTYNSEKITERTFEPDAARGDYYEIVVEVLKVNLAPFFSGLVSRFRGLETLIQKNTQK